MDKNIEVIPDGLYCYHDDVICPHFVPGTIPLCSLVGSPVRSPIGKKVCFIKMILPDDDEVIELN